ncbi:MAG TPA: MBG domain-containing protein [Acidobacteriaceae bacterium]
MTLAGHTLPVLAHATDLGRLSGSTAMNHLVMVLQSSPEQEHALQSLLDQQLDKGHVNFHKWMKPEEFGAHFGLADADIEQVTSWLTQQGFAVENVSPSKRLIQFSGNVGQVELAFQTEMHRYNVNGVMHVANSGDISVPAALQPVIAGVPTLHDFFKKSNMTDTRTVTADPDTGKLYESSPFTGHMPDYTNGTTHFLGAGDFASVYNTTPLIAGGNDGSGVSIGVIGRTDIHLSDVQIYRQMFGLKVNDPVFVVAGEDPGIVGGDDSESYLDVEVSGGAAPGATVKFIVSRATLTVDGVDLAAMYAVENNLTDIITESYGQCENNFSTAQAAFYSTLWAQAAAQGQSVFVSSGDNGPAACDNSNNTFATGGYAVNMLGSTPYNVSVGGTLFADTTGGPWWGTTATATPPFSSALGYIPEIPWNEAKGSGATAASGLWSGSGGISAYFGTPSWQRGFGVPVTDPAYAGTGAFSSPASPFVPGPHRYLPDVAMAAAAQHDGTLYCVEGICQLSSTNTIVNAGIVGGTSVAAPTMAGVQALIDQYNGGRQGLPTYQYYALADAQHTAGLVCASNMAGTTLDANCAFRDVTTGNTLVCADSGCTAAKKIGWTAAAGYDLATGLGSPNAAKLATLWSTVTFRSTTATLGLSKTTSIAHGESVTASGTVAPGSGAGVPTGTVALIASTGALGNPMSTSTGAFQNPVSTATLDGSGNYSLGVTNLPAGTYYLTARYSGDGTFASSLSAPIQVTVSSESSGVVIQPNSFNVAACNNEAPATTFTYGSYIWTDFTVTGTSGQGVPTGTVAITDNGSPLVTTSLNPNGVAHTLSGAIPTSSCLSGYTIQDTAPPTGGTHVMGATYSGDSTFNAMTATPVTVTINPATVLGALTTSATAIASGSSVQLTVTTTAISGAGPGTLSPTGLVTFTDTTTGTLLGTVNLSATTTLGAARAILTTTAITTSGDHSITASWAADTNYNAASVTVPVTVTVQGATSTSVAVTSNANPSTVGGRPTWTATMTPTTVTSGTVNFYDNGVLLGTGTVGAAHTTTFRPAATVSLPAGVHSITAAYAGNATFNSSTSPVFSQTFNQTATTLQLTVKNNGVAGQTFTMSGALGLAGTVVPAATGTVTFYDGATPIGSPQSFTIVSAASGGLGIFQAHLEYPFAVGTHTITAQLTDSNYTAPVSNAQTITVTAPPVLNYLVTTLTDDATGVALNCVSGATGAGGGNANCSLRDAIAGANAASSSTATTINFWSGNPALSSATAAIPAQYLTGPNGALSLINAGPLTINGPTSGTGSTLANLLAIDGGATTQIFQSSGTGATVLNNLIVRNGKAGALGGGILISGGTFTLNGSTVSGNSAVEAAGMFVSGGTVTVNNSTLSGNTSTGGGGGAIGISNTGGSTTLNQVTLTGNTASGGAGVTVFQGAVTLNNSTVAGNSASVGAGILTTSGSTANVNGSIVTDAVTNLGTYTPTNTVTTGSFTALGNYGGPTQTMLPLPGSAGICSVPTSSITPAIATNQNYTDQRGATHSAAYCTSTQLDAGAVQTNYSMGNTFTTQPPSVIGSGTVIGPNPAVTVTENGTGVSGAAVSMTAATGTVSGTASATSDTAGLATFNNLIVSGGAAGDTLVATLSLNSAATPAATLSLTSATFNSMLVSAPATLTGQVGVAYSQGVVASNGTSPYGYQSTGGPLPAGLTLDPSSGSISGTPTAGGSFPITVTATDNTSLTAVVNFTLIISPATVTVAPAALPTLTVGSTPTLSFTASGGTAPYTYSLGATTLPAGLTMDPSTGIVSGTPTTAGSYNFTVTATDSSTGTGPYVGTTTYTSSVNTGTATVTFTVGTLSQTYTGSPLSVTATTVPAGLTLTYSYVGTGATTYGPTATAPTNAGTYNATATVNDSNYTGTAGPTAFTIDKATATVVLGSLAQTYTGSPLAATATTTPTGLTVNFTYNGSATIPTNAGSYTVVGTISDANYQGTATSTLVIGKATAPVVLGSLAQTYTGSPLAATATTTPSGLTVTFTYNGIATVPTNAGSYTVVGTINDSNYQGTATSTLVIGKATAPVVLGSLAQTYSGSPLVATATTTPSGLTVTFTYNGSATLPVNAGSYTVVGTIVDANYQGTATSTLVVGKATAIVTLGSLAQTYNGFPLAATATTNPSPLNVDFTYNGSATIPTNAGSYTVVGTINDSNYQGTATSTLVIAKATAPVVLGNLSLTYNTSPQAATASTTPAGLTVVLTYNGSPTIPVNAGSYTVTGTINDPNYQGTSTSTMVIAKAVAPVTLGSLNQTYTSFPLAATATTTPAALTVNFTYNGSSTIPTNAGSYTVVGTINDINYQGSSTGTLNIGVATLTINAPRLNKLYGAAMPSLDGTYSGNLGSDTFTVTGTTDATATSQVLAGGYVITPSVTGPALANYRVIAVAGTLTVTPATLTITAPNLSKAYGAAVPSLSGTYSGNVNGDTFTISGVTSATAASPVVAGGYAITPVAVGPNVGSYTIVTVPGVLTITPITLTITAPNVSKVYGAALPSLNGTYTGNLPGDSFTITGTTTATATSPVLAGGYAITPTAVGANVGSYTIVSVPGVLTITPATLTITGPTLSKTYGAALPSLDGTYSGNAPGDTFTVTGTTTATATSPVLAGGYAITPAVTGANLSNYTVVKVNGTLNITAVTLTITAPTLNKAYGAALPSLNGTYTGNVNGDTFTITGTTTATAASPVVAGGYTITPVAAGTNLSSYNVVSVTGVLTITPVTLTITGPTVSKAYGAALPSLNGTFSGNVNGDTFTITGTTTATAASPVLAGGYPITPSASGTNLSSYTVVTVPGVLTITPGALTITGPAVSKVYGAALPSLNGTYSGNAPGDTFTVTGTTTATANSPVVAGGYAITPAVTGANLSNYTVTQVNGTLTVTAAPLTVTVAAATKTFGAANPTLTGTITGVVAGDGIVPVYSTTATTTSAVGTYPITATLSDPNSKLANYTVTNTPNTLTVTLATPTVTLTAAPASVLLQSPVVLTATVTSSGGTPSGTVTFLDGATSLGAPTLTNGVATLTVSNLAVGSHSITASYSGDAGFGKVTSTASTVVVQDFTLNVASGGSTSLTATRGGTASYSFTVSPGSGTFPAAITFSLSGLPSGATYTFAPPTIAAGAGATNVTLTIQVPATLAELHDNRPSVVRELAPISLALFALPFLAWKRRKVLGAARLLGMCLLLLAGASGALGITGCAKSNGSSTTPVTYSLTLTATSGSLSHTTPLTLTVQ